MATTVNNAFFEFMRDYVNLSPTRNNKAKESNDAMINRINGLQSFLPLYKSKHMQFGSFARKTKIRPIDDIDLLICLSGGDFEVVSGNAWNDYKLKLTNADSAFKQYCDATSYYNYGYYNNSTYYLNSNKVKNAFINALSNLQDCKKAELHSKGQAVTLQFTSYEWNFDIVPAFFVSNETYIANEYYLIPNGNGGWQKTNPKIDREYASSINQKCEGNVLELIRLVKYWNKRPTMASVPSYTLETMVLNYCEKNGCNKYIDLAFRDVLFYISQNIYYNVQDPKGIQGNINGLTYSQKQSVSQRANSDYAKVCDAINYEINEKGHQKSINKWREIFGGDFPTYG